MTRWALMLMAGAVGTIAVILYWAAARFLAELTADASKRREGPQALDRRYRH